MVSVESSPEQILNMLSKSITRKQTSIVDSVKSIKQSCLKEKRSMKENHGISNKLSIQIYNKKMWNSDYSVQKSKSNIAQTDANVSRPCFVCKNMTVISDLALLSWLVTNVIAVKWVRIVSFSCIFCFVIFLECRISYAFCFPCFHTVNVEIFWQRRYKNDRHQ